MLPMEIMLHGIDFSGARRFWPAPSIRLDDTQPKRVYLVKIGGEEFKAGPQTSTKLFHRRRIKGSKG